MTRFALGAKCGSPGSPPGDSGACASRSSFISVASAAAPMPVLESSRNRRRVTIFSNSVCGFIGQSFVMVRSRFRTMLATIV